MQGSENRLRLVVRSKKVLVRVDESEDSFLAWDGTVRTHRKRVKVYDYVFDDGQAQMLRDARRMAGKARLSLEVTDLSRQSAFRRMLWWGLSRENAAATDLVSPSEASIKQGSTLARS